MSTYDLYNQVYYQKNKDRIREKTKKYRQRYNEEYYLLNREKILASRKLKARERKLIKIRAKLDAKERAEEADRVSRLSKETIVTCWY